LYRLAIEAVRRLIVPARRVGAGLGLGFGSGSGIWEVRVHAIAPVVARRLSSAIQASSRAKLARSWRARIQSSARLRQSKPPTQYQRLFHIALGSVGTTRVVGWVVRQILTA